RSIIEPDLMSESTVSGLVVLEIFCTLFPALADSFLFLNHFSARVGELLALRSPRENRGNALMSLFSSSEAFGELKRLAPAIESIELMSDIAYVFLLKLSFFEESSLPESRPLSSTELRL